MRRGTDIHETFEYYYHTVEELGYAPGEVPFGELLPDDYTQWADYTVPYIKNFVDWERSRWLESEQTPSDYLPVSIEEEHWKECPVSEDAPEMMGLADAILPSASLSEIDSDTGVTVVDFKTGDVPDAKYRSPGIYEELEYYEMLFEDKYDVTGALAYYPRHNEVVVKPDSYRDEVVTGMGELVEASRGYDGSQQFEIDPGPLCGWSPDPDDRSSYYGVCSQCTWNVPVQNQERFEELIEEGRSDIEIADELGCGPGESSYWRYKLDL